MPNLSIIKQPPSIALLDDGLKLKIRTTNQYESAGSDAKLRLKFTDTTDYTDKSFDLEFADRSIKLTFKENPGEDGKEIRTRGAGQSLADFIDQVIVDLKNNYFLFKNYIVNKFIVVPDVEGVQITAREKGSAYDLDVSIPLAFGMSKYDKTAGSDATLRDNYRIVAEAFLKGAELNTSTIKGTDALPPDKDGDAYFDLKEYFKDRLSSGFLWPENIALYQQLPHGAKEIFFRYGEYWAGEVKKMFDTYSSPVIILPGGTSWRDKAFYNEYGTGYFDYDENDKRFLTWAPAEKVTSKLAREKLYFFIHEGKTINLKAKLTFDDDSEQTITPVANLVAENVSVYEFLVSYSILKLSDYEGTKDIRKWEIWIEDDSQTVLSEVRTFVLDQQDHFQERYFIFKNSFGHYDCIRCTGIFEKTNELRRRLIEQETDPDYQEKSAEIINFKSFQEETFKGNLGYISREMKNYLQEFTGSTKIFEARGDLLFPVVLTSKKVFQHVDDETLYDLEFEYKRAYTDENFSLQVPDEEIYYLTDENGEILVDENGAPFFDN